MLFFSEKIKRLPAMPQGIMALFFIQIVATLSFSVLYSTLVLYMRDKLAMSATTANSIMGVFIAFNYALHLLGGIWSGRFLSNRTLFALGMLAQALGCVVLVFPDDSYLYYGLAIYLTGSGLNVTSLNCMLTQRFSADDIRREKAFLWTYAGMNIGFFTGYTVSGFFQLTQNYQQLFLLGSLGNVLALMICLYCWKQLSDKDTLLSRREKKDQQRYRLAGLLSIFILPFILTGIIHYSAWANKLVLFTGAVMFLGLLVFAYQQPEKKEKQKLIAFAILMLISTVFWMLYQTSPMGLTFFIAHNVQRSVGGFIIPPQWFQNINTFSIIIGGPLLGILFSKMRARSIQIDIPGQFAMALLLIGCAFVFLPISIYFADAEGMVNPWWMVLSYMLQSFGELLISPIGFAMIGSLASAPLQGMMMGMWMLNTGVGATLASYGSNLMTDHSDRVIPLLTNARYSHVFLILGLVALISSGLLWLIIPWLRSLMYERKRLSCPDLNLDSVRVACE